MEATKASIDSVIDKTTGQFVRTESQFRDFVSLKPGAKFAPEKGRYHLYVSYACPWAHRTLIVRQLKGLEDIIDYTSVHWFNDIGGKGWRFATSDENLPGANTVPDPINGAEYIKEIYFKANPDYTARFSVPLLWDKKTNTIVSNESSEIIRMFESEFDGLLDEEHRNVRLVPENLREKIDELNAWIYDDINNGVYKCGMAKTQEAYEMNVIQLFSSLDRVEELLKNSTGPYILGTQLTEVDVRLYPTIVRFDPVYVSLFKANNATIRSGYPAIHKWLLHFYWDLPIFHDTTNFEHIKKHYFTSILPLNPSGVVPFGPVPNIMGKTSIGI